MCNRRTADPLVRAFLDRYGLNLLSIPRQFVNCGDVYISRDQQISTPARLQDLLQPAPLLPAPVTDERLADLAFIVSDGVSVSAGLNVLGNILVALGAGALIGGLKSDYQSSKSARLRFRVREATRDHIDPAALGAALKGCRLDGSHPLVADGNSYYVVSAVVRTQTISITAEDVMGNTVDVGTDVIQAADAHANLAVTRGSNGEVSYRGKEKLAVGVELYELSHDREEHTLKMRLPPRRPRTLRSSQRAPVRELEPAFIGGSDGDAFIVTSDRLVP
jgi:hypothetical protein